MAAYALALMAIMSIAGGAVCATDKRAARCGARRVSERTLWAFALLMGACGVLISMLALRHKTRKKRFMVFVPLLAAAQIALILWFWAAGM